MRLLLSLLFLPLFLLLIQCAKSLPLCSVSPYLLTFYHCCLLYLPSFVFLYSMQNALRHSFITLLLSAYYFCQKRKSFNTDYTVFFGKKNTQLASPCNINTIPVASTKRETNILSKASSCSSWTVAYMDM